MLSQTRTISRPFPRTSHFSEWSRLYVRRLMGDESPGPRFVPRYTPRQPTQLSGLNIGKGPRLSQYTSGRGLIHVAT